MHICNEGGVLTFSAYLEVVCAVGGQHHPISTCFVPLQDCRGIALYSTSETILPVITCRACICFYQSGIFGRWLVNLRSSLQ
jgi:hypothetical protein